MQAGDSTISTDPNSALPPVRLARNRSLLVRLVLSLLLAGGFFWGLRVGGLPMFPANAAFGLLNPWSVVVFVLLYCVNTLLRTYRWVYLLRPINPAVSGLRVLALGLVGFGAILFAPLRMGELARPWLLSRDRQINFVQAAGTVIAERIVDGLVMALLLAAGVAFAKPLSPLPDHVGRTPLPVAAVPVIASLALVGFFGGFVALALFYFARSWAERAVRLVVGAVSQPLAAWLTQQIERFSDSLQFLISRRHGFAFLRDTVAYWSVSLLSYYVLLRGASAPANLAQTCVVMGVMGLGTLLPSGPGFFGTYQLAAYSGLAMFFPEQMVVGAGAVFIFISYVTQLIFTGLFLLLGLWMMRRLPVAHSDSGSVRAELGN